MGGETEQYKGAEVTEGSPEKATEQVEQTSEKLDQSDVVDSTKDGE